MKSGIFKLNRRPPLLVERFDLRGLFWEIRISSNVIIFFFVMHEIVKGCFYSGHADIGRCICLKFRPVPPRRGLQPGLIRFERGVSTG